MNELGDVSLLYIIDSLALRKYAITAFISFADLSIIVVYGVIQLNIAVASMPIFNVIVLFVPFVY